jgi:two-component system response regulator TctD
MRVLIVEDNDTYARLVATRMMQSGFEADLVGSVQEAENAIAKKEYVAIILDLGLPDQDGITLLHGLRLRGDTTPVLIVTARHTLLSRIDGLKEGADDYLVKPFSMDELIARLRAVLRRPEEFASADLSVGNVSLNSKSRLLTVGHHLQPCRMSEIAVLEVLMRHKGRVISRNFVEQRVFGPNDEPESNAIDVCIYRLRRHLADAGATVKIHTIRGVGYMMSEDKNEPSAS